MGLKQMIVTQHNARVHLAASCGVIVLGLICRLSRLEWALIVLAMVAVWATEAVNTAIEQLCDYFTTDHHPLIEKGKDVAAAAVLIAAMGAVVVGVLVFYPHLF